VGQGLRLDGFLFELDSESGLHFMPDGVAEREDIGGGSVTSID